MEIYQCPLKPNFLLLLALYASCLGLLAFTPEEQDEEVMLWRCERQLTYADFKADTASVRHSAVSCLKIIPSLFIEGNILRYKIEAGFYPRCSYMKYYDQRLLKHEQRHFDMVEVYARKMRRYLHSCINTNVSAIDLNAALTKLDADLQSVQSTYDHVTDHGLKLPAQAHWDKQIKAALDSLNEYSRPDGVITLTLKKHR